MQRYDIQRPFMRSLQTDLGGASLVMGLQKSSRAQAPLVAGLQAGKTKLGMGGAQVIADIFRVGQEFRGHQRADRVAAMVLGAGVAMTVAKIAGRRVVRAQLERAATDLERTEIVAPLAQA